MVIACDNAVSRLPLRTRVAVGAYLCVLRDLRKQVFGSVWWLRDSSAAPFRGSGRCCRRTDGGGDLRLNGLNFARTVLAVRASSGKVPPPCSSRSSPTPVTRRLHRSPPRVLSLATAGQFSAPPLFPEGEQSAPDSPMDVLSPSVGFLEEFKHRPMGSPIGLHQACQCQ